MAIIIRCVKKNKLKNTYYGVVWLKKKQTTYNVK